MSRMPSTRPHSVARSRCPRCIPWPCWLTRILHLPGRSTRLFRTHSKSCSHFRMIPNRHSQSTRTRSSLTRATRDPRHSHSVYSSQIRVGSTRVTVGCTLTCSTLRSVTTYQFFFLSINFLLLQCWLASQPTRVNLCSVLHVHATCLKVVCQILHRSEIRKSSFWSFPFFWYTFLIYSSVCRYLLII